jgi:hypothetical protein
MAGSIVPLVRDLEDPMSSTEANRVPIGMWPTERLV